MILAIATRNQHKVFEIQAMLPDAIQCVSLADFRDPPVVVEDAQTFAGNAAKKSIALARWLEVAPDRLPPQVREPPGPVLCLGDDSGLEVDALNGAPGVHSARFAALDSGLAGNSSDSANNEKLLRLLQDVPMEQRTARFRCCLAVTSTSFVESQTVPALFEGTCEGRIIREPKGTHGFGYDPLFVPEGYTESFAELGSAIKNEISHRSKALQQLCEWLRRLS